jgi:hypothetical protein
MLPAQQFGHLRIAQRGLVVGDRILVELSEA